MKIWCQVMAQGFGMPDFVSEAFSDFLRYADPNIIRAYLGWFEDKPVATSFLSLTAGVAGIYNVVSDDRLKAAGWEPWYHTAQTFASLYGATLASREKLTGRQAS